VDEREASPTRGASGLERLMPALTGIRGVAALWVVSYHYAISPLDELRLDAILPFVRYGYLGVDLFFVLSGFVITHVHRRDAASLAPRPVLRFLSLRLARIYPAHVVTLGSLVPMVAAGALFGIAPHHPEDFRLRDFAYNLLLVQSWGVADDIHWNFPAWSVSSEWLAYLLFPLFALTLARIATARQAVLWLGLELAGFALAYVFYFDCRLDLRFDVGGFAPLALARTGFEFAAGALAYKVLELIDLRRWAWSAIAAAALAAAVALAHSPARDMAIVAFGGAAIVAGAFPGTLVACMLRAAPILWLGEISYSLYMVHAPLRMTLGKAVAAVLARAGSPAVAWLAAVFMFAATIAAGALLHALVEAPSRGWMCRRIATALYFRPRAPSAAPARSLRDWAASPDGPLQAPGEAPMNRRDFREFGQ
jgi:peptidoglycan/LPS O-acetylase OafA/YrhL